MDEQWTEIVLRVGTAQLSCAEEIAARHSPGGIYVEDYSDMDAMLPLIGGVDYVDEALKGQDKCHGAIHVYIPSLEDPAQTAELLSIELKAAGIDFSIDSAGLEAQDWANQWKSFHHSEKVGRRLVLCPTWEEYSPKADEIVLTLDPGEAFGSGRSETTRLCLSLLDSYGSPGDRILDMGCGSGVLAIAALLLGAKSAIGVDVEKTALKESVENAALNGVGDRLSVHFGNVLSDEGLRLALGEGYDLISANIVADVHLAMGSFYYEKLKSGGILIVSGILNERAAQVKAALSNCGFTLLEELQENEWTALSFKKC